MLAITSKSPSAVRALSELTRMGGAGPVPIGEIARRRDLPVQFLEGLFATLRRSGILNSQRGVKGGYSFAREPREITVLEVVEALEGALDGDPALRDPLWGGAVGALRDRLAAVTIADVAERESREAGAAMYYI